MEKVTKLYAEGIYLLEGKAVAKNLFFENELDIRQAHRFAKRYFHGMMDIMAYNFTPHGWSLIIKTKSEEEIQKTYLERRIRSKTAKITSVKEKIEEMISEHIRFFLSALVKAINRRTGRKGSKVERVFERYIFQDLEEYKKYRDKIGNEEMESDQEKKYKGKEEDFDRASVENEGIMRGVAVKKGLEKVEA